MEEPQEHNLNRPNQDALLIACQKGSEDAFRKLFEHNHKRILHLAFQLSGNSQEAEDITQEVFLKVYQEIANFQATSSLFTWLYRITINLCLDKRRKRQRRDKYHAEALDSGSTNFDKTIFDPSNRVLEQNIWQDELQEMLQAALNKIKPKLRTVVVLKDIEGLSYEDVAQIVGCAEGTVSSRLNRGRKQLKRILSQMGIDKSYFQER